MTFDRKAALPLGHRLYTSVATLASWGSGGERGPSSEDYESRGRRMTWAEFYAVALHYIDNPHLIDTSKLKVVAEPAARRAPIKKPPVEYWTAGREYRFPESIVTARRWAWLAALGSAIPANARRRSPAYTAPKRTVVASIHDGPTLEWLAERNAAGHAIDYGAEGTRIERALVKDESPLVFTLQRVAELMRPPVIAANDNAPSDEDADADRGTGLERVHNQSAFQPSVPMLLKAVSDGMRPRFIRHMDGKVTRIATGHELSGGWHLAGWKEGRTKLSGVIINDGELVAYGDDDGRRRRPSYNPKVAKAVVEEDSETAKHKAARADENLAYTRMSAAGTYVSAQHLDAPRSLAPPPRTSRAVANDNVLAKARANTKAMPAVKRYEDGVAFKYGRLAGVADLTGIGEGRTSAPMHDVLSEMDRAAKLEAAGLFREDLDVVEDILSDASFRTIGIERGYAESAAHRMGRKVVERALKRISEKIAA